MVASVPGLSELPRGEDLPYDDGEPLETFRHRQQMNVLLESLAHAWAGRDVYITGNMALYFSATQAKNQDFRAPDFYVMKDVDPKERKSWVTWEEGGKTPDLVIELLSESTESVDRGRKKDIYATVLKVPEYVLFDPWDQRLEGFQLDVRRNRYVPLSLHPDGRLYLPSFGYSLGTRVGVYTGITCPWLRFFDAHGNLIQLPAEAAQEEAELAQEKAIVAEEKANLAEEKANLAEEKANLAEEKADLAADLAEEKANLAEEKANLAEEKANLAQEKASLAQQTAGSALRRAAQAEDAAEQARAESQRLKALLAAAGIDPSQA